MNKFYIFISILVLLFVGKCFSNTEVVVQKNDSISSILSHHSFKHIYGKDGALRKTLELNPKYKKNPNLIYAGQTLIIPDGVTVSNESNQDPVIDNITETENDISPLDQIPSDTENVNASDDVVLVEEAPIQRKSYFTIKLSETMYKVDGENVSGASGSMGSSPSPSIEVSWNPKLSNKLNADLGISYGMVKFSQDSNRVFTNRDHNLLNFYAGLNYYLNERHLLGFHLGKMDQVLYSFKSNTINGEKLAIPFARLFGKFKLFDFYSTQFFIKPGYIHSFSKDSGNVKVNSGSGIFASLIWEMTMFNHEMFLEGTVLRNKFSADPGDFTSNELSVGIGIKF